MRKFKYLVLLVAAIFALAACSETMTEPDPEVTSVIVSPASATIDEGATVSLSAVVQGTDLGDDDKGVTWSATGNGSVDANGVVTAGAGAGTINVTATAACCDGQDPKVTGQAVITVQEVVEPVTTGSITVNVTPNAADVTVAGPTPVADFSGDKVLTDLDPGQYTINASAAGFIADSAIANVVAGGSASVTIILEEEVVEPTDGRLIINVNPAGATVVVTNEADEEVFNGAAPVNVVVPEGSYNYTASLEDYEGQVGAAFVAAGDDTIVNLALEEIDNETQPTPVPASITLLYSRDAASVAGDVSSYIPAVNEGIVNDQKPGVMLHAAQQEEAICLFFEVLDENGDPIEGAPVTLQNTGILGSEDILSIVPGCDAGVTTDTISIDSVTDENGIAIFTIQSTFGGGGGTLLHNPEPVKFLASASQANVANPTNMTTEFKYWFFNITHLRYQETLADGTPLGAAVDIPDRVGSTVGPFADAYNARRAQYFTSYVDGKQGVFIDENIGPGTFNLGTVFGFELPTSALYYMRYVVSGDTDKVSWVNCDYVDAANVCYDLNLTGNNGLINIDPITFQVLPGDGNVGLDVVSGLDDVEDFPIEFTVDAEMVIVIGYDLTEDDLEAFAATLTNAVATIVGNPLSAAAHATAIGSIVNLLEAYPVKFPLKSYTFDKVIDRSFLEITKVVDHHVLTWSGGGVFGTRPDRTLEQTRTIGEPWTATYTITVDNVGRNQANSISITDAMQPELGYVAGSGRVLAPESLACDNEADCAASTNVDITYSGALHQITWEGEALDPVDLPQGESIVVAFDVYARQKPGFCWDATEVGFAPARPPLTNSIAAIGAGCLNPYNDPYQTINGEYAFDVTVEADGIDPIDYTPIENDVEVWVVRPLFTLDKYFLEPAQFAGVGLNVYANSENNPSGVLFDRSHIPTITVQEDDNVRFGFNVTNVNRVTNPGDSAVYDQLAAEFPYELGFSTDIAAAIADQHPDVAADFVARANPYGNTIANGTIQDRFDEFGLDYDTSTGTPVIANNTIIGAAYNVGALMDHGSQAFNDDFMSVTASEISFGVNGFLNCAYFDAANLNQPSNLDPEDLDHDYLPEPWGVFEEILAPGFTADFSSVLEDCVQVLVNPRPLVSLQFSMVDHGDGVQTGADQGDEFGAGLSFNLISALFNEAESDEGLVDNVFTYVLGENSFAFNGITVEYVVDYQGINADGDLVPGFTSSTVLVQGVDYTVSADGRNLSIPAGPNGLLPGDAYRITHNVTSSVTGNFDSEFEFRAVGAVSGTSIEPEFGASDNTTIVP